MESAAPLVYNIYLCDRAVTGDGPGTVVRQWGPCSGVGEAGRPNGQHCSEMTETAVSVGGLALWRGHPAHRCRPSSVVRALGRQRSILRVHLSSPLRQSVRAYSERERRAGRVGANLPYPVSRSQSRTSMNDARPWKLYTPPGIHVHRRCDICMPFDTSDGPQ